jgi:hypothetical protein
MWRTIFSLTFLAGLFLVVPWIADSSRPVAPRTAYAFTEPEAVFDVDRLYVESRNRALQIATTEEVRAFKGMSLTRMVDTLETSGERERRIVGALLGASGHPDAVKPLVTAFESETDPRTIAALAMALAETRRNEAIEALIDAIRIRHGTTAYEACRALNTVFGVSFGLDADAWAKWLRTTTATRD